MQLLEIDPGISYSKEINIQRRTINLLPYKYQICKI